MFPLITNVHLNLTHRCNLACRYCYVSQEPLDMSWQVAKDSADFLARNAREANTQPLICFFGGEPLLKYNEIIVPLVEYIEETHPDVGFKFTITTNSVLLTDDKIAFLKKHRFGILTSIDGCPATQNYNRPLHGDIGSASVVESHVRKLLANGFMPTFRSTIIPATCGNAYNDYLYAISLRYRTMFALTDSFSEWDEESKKTLEEEYKKIADHFIAFFKEKHRPPIRLTLLERYLRKGLQEKADAEKGIKTQRAPYTSAAHCGLGRMGVAAISPTGDIYGCQEMTSNEGKESIFYIGNIYDGVDDKLREKLMAAYDAEPCRGDMDCSECEANVVCAGGCVANNYMKTGALNRASHGCCFYQRMLHRIAAYIVDELKDELNFVGMLNSQKQKQNKKQTPQTQNGQAIGQTSGKVCRNCDTCQVCDECQVKDRA